MTITSDPRPNLAAAAEACATLADTLTPDQLGLPTPCDAFDVRALLGHIVGVLDRLHAAGRGDDPMAVDAVGIELADGEWAAAIRSRLTSGAALWADDAKLADTFVFPWATQNGADTLRMWTNEFVVHGWDLATAVGDTLPIDEALAQQALDVARQSLPVADRTPMWDAMAKNFGLEPGQFVGPFANAVPIADDAPTLDRVAAWYGRTPR